MTDSKNRHDTFADSDRDQKRRRPERPTDQFTRTWYTHNDHAFLSAMWDAYPHLWQIWIRRQRLQGHLPSHNSG